MFEEHIQGLFNHCVVGRQVGIEIIEIGEGYAKGKLELKKEHLNVFGSIHGGILFTFADHVGGACGNTFGKRSVLVESAIQYLKALPGEGIIFAEARLIHKGRRIGRIDIKVQKENGELVAIMNMIFFQTDEDHTTKASQNI